MADLPNCPASREEMYMASIAGQNVEIPACPQSRKEAYLESIDGRVENLQNEIEEIKNNPDVADIVDTYADLQSYDTSTLTDKDVIRVLNDETHDGNSTYYRWSTSSQTWTYIGSSKQYSDFVGTDGTEDGEAGLVPAPVAADADKYLKSDGTWSEVDAGPTVVQTTGTSTTDVMSQNAVTKMVFTNNNKSGVNLTDGSTAYLSGITIGTGAQTTKALSIAIGSSGGGGHVSATGISSIAISNHASASSDGSIALGAYSNATSVGEMNIGSTDTTFGYNNSNYRLLTGLYDGQSAHDAATVGQLPSSYSTSEFNNLWENA